MTLLFLMMTLLSQFGFQYTISRSTFNLSGGYEMKYALARPELSAQGDILLVLHYGWDQKQGVPDYYGEHFMRSMILPALIPTCLKPLVVAPDCPDNTWYTEKSASALMELISFLSEKQAHSDGRLIVAGYSAGGLGAWYFAHAYPEEVDICMSLAAIPDKSWVEDWKIEHTLLIHGETDELFPLNDLKEILEGIGVDAYKPELQLVNQTGHYDMGAYRYYIQQGFRSFCLE